MQFADHQQRDMRMDLYQASALCPGVEMYPQSGKTLQLACDLKCHTLETEFPVQATVLRGGASNKQSDDECSSLTGE